MALGQACERREEGGHFRTASLRDRPAGFLGLQRKPGARPMLHYISIGKI